MAHARKHFRTIYALLDPLSQTRQICYVGCTVQPLHHRLQAHLREATAEDSLSHKAQWIRALLAIGEEPIIEPLEIVADDDWQEREQYWIQHHAGPELLNVAPGGVGVRRMPEETRRKISQTLTGRKQSEETIARRKATAAANPYKHPEEVKARIAAARRATRGKNGPLDQETKDKLRAKMASLVWVNDGRVNRRVPKDGIPPGFTLGRI